MMEQKNTLSNYLYNNLKEQILTGILPYGAALPSISQLCDIYNVGIRTVRDVLKKLAQEGFIRTEERRPSVVIYCQCVPNTEKAVYTVLQHKRAVLSVYHTIAALMPPLFTFSADICDKEKLQQYLWLLEQDKRYHRNKWQIYSVFLHNLLDASENLLFRDIYVSLEIYAEIPFFWERREDFPYCGERAGKQDTYWRPDLLKPETTAEGFHYFSALFRSTSNIIETYMENLSFLYPKIEDSGRDPFSWSSTLGRDHYYMQITQDIIDKIGTGYYGDREFLPPEAVLARQYRVSVATIRKALATLNTLGFCRTYNVKGTQVVLFNDAATYSCMKDRLYRKDTLIYLSGLQFMILAIPPAVVLIFERITPDMKKDMKARCQLPNSIPVDIIMECVIGMLPLPPFQHIMREVKSLLHWGYYFSFYAEGNHRSNKINLMGLEALDHLLQNDCAAFTEQLSDCYRYLLAFVRDFMTECGLPEAERLVTPDKCYCAFSLSCMEEGPD